MHAVYTVTSKVQVFAKTYRKVPAEAAAVKTRLQLSVGTHLRSQRHVSFDSPCCWSILRMTFSEI